MGKISFDIILTLKNNILGGLVNIKKQFDAIDKAGEQASATTTRFGNICSRLKMPDLNAFLGVAERLGGVLGDLSQGGMNFGQSMADLSSITGIAGDDLKTLGENARKVGQDSGLGAGTAARAYAILASQIDVAVIGMAGLNNLQEKSVTLAQASGMSIDAAATSLAGTINQFGLSANEAERVINVLAAGSKYGAAEIEELSQSFKVVGSAASAMGLTVEQSAGALEVLSKANLKGSEAGTALRNIILKLNTELGVDLSRTSLSTALDALKPKLTDAAYLSKLFGMENIAAAQYLIQNSSAVEEMTQKVTGTNVAQEQAAVRTDTTAHKMEILRAKVDDIKISFANSLGPMSAYASVVGENAVVLASFYQIGTGAISMLSKYHIAAKTAVVAQMAFNSILKLGKATVLSYAMNVNLARNSIVATTGATKLMNIAIAASPYMLAAVAAVALGVAVYKIATRSNEAEKAQNRLNEAMTSMQKEVTEERLKLDALFAPLLNAKEGTDEWKRARDRIQETYGDYLQQLGIEEIKVDNARKAYDLLSEAIINTARARAGEKALTSAGDSLAGKESEMLTKMRSILTQKFGEETGARVFDGIANSIRKGEKEIPERWAKFIKRLDVTEVYGQAGEVNTTNPVMTYVNGIKQARTDYEKEYDRIVSVFGKTIPGPKVPQKTVKGEGNKEDDNLQKESLTLADIKKKIEELQSAQQTASDEEGRNIQIQINQLESLKKAKEKAMGIGGDPTFMNGSIDAMKNELAKYEKELSSKPIGEASIDLQIKIDNLKSQIEGVKIWIEKEAFKDTHGEIKVDVIPSSNAGRDLGQMAEDFQDERNKKNPDSEQNTLTHDAIKKMKLPQIEMPKIDPKKSGFEKWNEAVDTAYKKNQDLIEGMSGIGSVMGSLGQAVGGAAGEWLNWGANVVQAVAAAIPQITSLLGLQTTQVAANTAVAGSGAAASTASIPIVGPILAVAAVASVLAALANLPKFASGAIAYGPTMGLFGEYSGAQNNPEVVAPLNKLRNLIQPTGGMGGVVEFRIDGRMLRGVLNKVDRYNQRTR
ncbi:MAG: phage tail tape measure protein [Bacteroides thetaiotaomicron]|jgi:TP901 family phage tail tape measure protein|uniref:phage tail tape measure protein n=2 Tax=Bacteroides thetaiotaomicron TaxID=818 RepID=UPI000E4998D5|nr:phage tail tape measure protein [Bacteroides thetaiotaomicron]DAJ94031.1 MAG TPA: minor tail protein [Caudoviricetes sp.]MCE8993899.1 phage tail tape measure protein [Bacteroides thetaiotaomicron]MCE9245446.1 phage tail tape measure protein [Bacteroides thetaiotaomicron]QZU78707.1 Phage-related minor tail protein [Bacteroides thetaiotaomicron]QZU84118.1 Phage-related minor tail protein [Bacteroides thetaiotaomicron]